MNKDEAKIMLPDGRIAYDCAKLAEFQIDGIKLEDYPNHVILVRTRNTLYGFITRDGQVEGKACKDDGSIPKYLAEHTKDIHIAGSTWGGSALKIGYIGVGMHLEFYAEGKTITTSEIQSVRVSPLEQREAA